MRKENWPELLNDYLALPHKFDWVICNCALFAADGIIAITGKDFAAEYRGLKTKRGMIHRMMRECGGDVVALAILKKGPPKSVKVAKRGDIVSCKFNDENTLGICNGVNSLFVSEIGDKVFVKTLECDNAWTI